MKHNYMIHMMGAERGETFIFGESPESIRDTDNYKDFRDDNYDEIGVYQVMLLDGKDYLVEAYEAEGL